jgi:alcohol dehydrogenase
MAQTWHIEPFWEDRAVRAVYYEEFRGPVTVRSVPDPEPTPDGVVIRVQATGLCRSDWHGWMGHDADVRVPHVPGHELAGVVESTGAEVKCWQPGDRVTLPFVCGCGSCPQCASGNHQVCDHQFQPGFTHWGSFAEYVAIRYADINLVRLPESVDFVTAASLGCRFATSFRAVVDQGRIARDQWLAVHGCGGVGLSAVMIARALGARVIAVDIDDAKLALARDLGAAACIDGTESHNVAAEVRELSDGGVQVSIDALGSAVTCFNSIAGLRKRGRHVQVGLLPPEERDARIPTGLVVANELEILGSHGMQAHRYPQMLEMITEGVLQPEKLIGRRIGLDEAPEALVSMDRFSEVGVAIIDPFASDRDGRTW